MDPAPPPAPRATVDRALPAGVYVLGFSLFAMGSAEFLLAGVLPAVAADLGVTLSTAGFLITAFAVGVVVGGPPFAVLSLAWPRRTSLVATQVVFAASIGLGLLGGYPLLLVSRVVAGIAYAAFFAVATATAISLVGPDRRARASGVVVSGLSIAMVAGGPAGLSLSRLTDWRGGFWAVVALTLAGAVACLTTLPSDSAARLGGRPSLRREVGVMARPRLWGLLAVTVLTTASYMITFNYLSAMLETISDMSPTWIPGVLALFGVGAFIGLGVGGRIADARPHLALLAGAGGVVGLSAAFWFAVHEAWAATLVVLLLGVAGFVLNPAVYGRAFELAADAPTLGGAVTVSAFQLGISLTPLLAALLLGGGAPLPALSLAGSVLALAACGLVAVDWRLTRRPPPPSPLWAGPDAGDHADAGHS